MKNTLYSDVMLLRFYGFFGLKSLFTIVRTTPRESESSFLKSELKCLFREEEVNIVCISFQVRRLRIATLLFSRFSFLYII